MEFELDRSIEILERTPAILKAYLVGLPEKWLKSNEGENTWSPYDIVGHLIFGEKTDWIIRIKTILSSSENKLFEPFDRFAQLKDDQNIPISDLLEIFVQLEIALTFQYFYLALYAINCTSLCLSITITYTASLVISVANVEFIFLACPPINH